MFGWLQINLALFLAFMTPVIEIEPDKIICHLENKNIVTKEMSKLLAHGVEFEFRLYISLTASGPSGRELLKKSINQKIYYNYLKEHYVLERDGYKTKTFPSLEKLLSSSRRFPGIKFILQTEKYNKFQLFSQIDLIENKIIAEKLNMSTGDFWKGIKISINHTELNSKTFSNTGTGNK